MPGQNNTFYSQTDTEVLIKLVDYYYKKYRMGPIDTITKTMVRVRSSYGLEVMFKDYPGEIYAARKDSPMIIGIAGGETYVAPDVPAILKYTRSVYYIGNRELARLTPGKAVFYDLNGDEVEKEPIEITFSAEAAEKGGFEHFMMKEIHEQPKAIQDTLNSVIRNGQIDLSTLGLTDEEIRDVSQLYMVACGSAWHVGMAAQYVFEDLARLPVRVEATKSSKCNRRIKENFSRGFPAQAFSWAGIDQIDHILKSLLRQCTEIIAFWVEEAQDIVRVFIGAALPWFVRLSKINGCLQFFLQQLKLRELGAIVQRDTQTRQLI